MLLRDPSGRVVLVDGGRDPLVLDEALRRHHIGRVDLLVGTHGDVDHIGGFEGIFDDHSVGRLWVPDHPDQGLEMEDLVGAAIAAAVPVDRVQPGISYTLGSIEIEAVGPRRRYAARNDGSIVLWVVADQSLLLPGDIGAVAQRELPAAPTGHSPGPAPWVVVDRPLVAGRNRRGCLGHQRRAEHLRPPDTGDLERPE